MKMHDASKIQILVREAILSRFERMLAFEKDVAIGRDIEAVHQMRVFSRRLVAALTTFEQCFQKTQYRKVLQRVRRLTRALGEVRDLDVQLDFLNHYMKRIPAHKRNGIIVLKRKLVVMRNHRRRLLLQTLRHVHTQVLLKDAMRLVFGSIRQCESLRSMMLSSLHDVQRKAEKRALVLRKAFTLLSLHRYRIALKKLRYRMEIFEPYFKKPYRKYLKKVRDTQTLLGNVQDTRVWLNLLTSKTLRFTTKENIGIKGLIAERKRTQTSLITTFRRQYKEFKKLQESIDFSTLLKK